MKPELTEKKSSFTKASQKDMVLMSGRELIQNSHLKSLGDLSEDQLNENIIFQITKELLTEYNVSKKIGSGGFGVTYSGYNLQTNKKVAIKAVSKTRFLHLSSATRKMYFNDLRCEIDILRKVEHKNIIQLYDIFEDHDFIYLVQELCEGGELLDRIISYQQYTESDARDIIKQIIEGIAYLHQHKVAHCDIKPENFLFTSKDSNELKIIDFGMSRILKSREYLTEQAGTPYYMAPEVIDSLYNYESDMWSVGVVLFVMLFGYPPFNVGSQDPNARGADIKIMKAVKKGFTPVVKDGHGAWFPSDVPVSENVKDFISKLLVVDVAKRLTAVESLNHPWIRDTDISDNVISPLTVESLARFNGTCHFRNALLEVFTGDMTEEQIQEVKDEFMSMDLNNDGVISAEELKNVLKKAKTEVNISQIDINLGDNKQVENDYLDEQVKVIMNYTDVDGDGVIDYNELLIACLNRKLVSKEERLFSKFQELDIDKNGKITKKELMTVLDKGNDFLTENQVNDMISMADENGDQMIDYEEFVKIWIDKNTTPLTKVDGFTPKDLPSIQKPEEPNKSCCVLL